MNLFSFIQEVKAELSKVVWPSKKETVELTILVIVVSVLIGAYVGGLDFIFTSILDIILKGK